MGEFPREKINFEKMLPIWLRVLKIQEELKMSEFGADIERAIKKLNRKNNLL